MLSAAEESLLLVRVLVGDMEPLLLESIGDDIDELPFSGSVLGRSAGG